jgi:hypothetical protein
MAILTLDSFGKHFSSCRRLFVCKTASNNTFRKLEKEKLPVKKNSVRVLMAVVGLALALGSFGSAGALPALAKADTTTTNVKVPFDNEITFVSCANGGAGEDVHFTGYSHEVFHVTLHPSGEYQMTAHFNLQGAKGTGLTTGDTYQVIHNGNQVVHIGKVGDTFIEVLNFRIIGPGPGNNYLSHMNFYVTVNANGEVTTQVENIKVTCK